MIQMNLQNRLSDLKKELMVARGWGKDGGKV